MIELSIERVEETDEYAVTWKEDGELVEAKTYYTDDLEDARLTLADMMERIRLQGEEFTVRVNKLTGSISPKRRETLRESFHRAESKLLPSTMMTSTQRGQMEGIDNLAMPPRSLFMSCLECGIIDQQVGSTTEGKVFIEDHAGHRTKYRSVILR